MMRKVYKSLLSIALPLATLGTLAYASSVRAQSITPDGTLSTEVQSNDNLNFDITKGDRQGNNLFHSFKDFSVLKDSSARFLNPTDIANIFSRVTGGNISEINGLIQAQGTANLFLINPSGIIFGPNASLNIGGSFFGSTASSIVFDDGVEFSATDTQPSPLLTVNIPIGLRFRDNPGSITNRSVVANGNNFPSGLPFASGIQTDATLALVGGDVNFEGGGIFAPGARVEIGGLSTEGVVGINDDLSLSFPEGVARADVSFNNAARVDVRGLDRGSIIINAKDVNILGGSALGAGIFPDSSGSLEAQAGNILINAENKLTIQGENTSSLIANIVGRNAQGNAGNVVINTTSLEAKGRFAIASSTFGQGNAGKVIITATEKISLEGSQQFSGSGIASIVAPGAVGDAKDVTINTPSLSLSNFSQIATSTTGQGNAANIQINASKSVSVSSGSVLQATTLNSGNAGKIIIEAESADVSFDGLNTTATTSVLGRNEILGVPVIGTGQGGNIKIKALNLSVTNGAQLFTSTLGEVGASGLLPNAGNIQINVSDNIILNEGSRISSNTSGFGNAGSVTIDGIDGKLPRILFDGKNGTLSSGIFTTVGRVTPEPPEIRIAGDINITAQSLELTNGAAINSSTSGTGNAGKILVTVDDSINLANSSQIRSAVESGAQGIGGDITLKGRSLTLTEGAQILNLLFRTSDGKPGGIGKAGNIVIDMTDFVNISGVDEARFSSGLLASAEEGTTFNNFDVDDKSQAAGDITVTTGDFRITDDGLVNASTFNSGDGGKITINANNFTANSGGRILTNTSGEGNAGDIKLNIADRVTIAGENSGIFARTFSTGKGGNIDIDPKTVEILDKAQISAESFGTGVAGDINIVSDEILLLRRGGKISTASTTDGGNIKIKTGVLVTLPNENSDITASAKNQGGKIEIDALGIFGFKFRSQQDLESLGVEDFSKVPTSDISATGGNPTLTGEIIVNNPEIDPNSGLIELPETVVDAKKQVAQNPCQQGVGSEFIATGRGGLPPNPTDDLTSSAVRVDLTKPVASKTTNTIAIQPKSTPTARKIVPAQGWIFNSKGQVVLTAYDPNKVGVQRTAHKGLCRAK